MEARSLLVASWMAVALGGCCCPGGPSSTCTAAVEYVGGSYASANPFVGSGSGSTEAQAKTNACWDYCFQADGAFQGIFQIWLAGAEGQAVQSRRRASGREVSIRRVIIDETTSLEQPFGQCVSRCEADAAAGRNGLRFRPATCS